MLLGFYYFRTASLRRRAVNLENTVQRRTQELAKEKQKVELLLLRKNDEFANISHEFRTPLTLLLGPTQKLLEQDISEFVNGKDNIIKRNAYRLLRMVDQLLQMEIFRVRSITPQSIQASHTIIQHIAESFKNLAEEQGIEFNILETDEVYFEFTPDALDKIVLNLLSNALKYTPSGGAIQINSFHNKHDQLEIRVKDSGIGIHQMIKKLSLNGSTASSMRKANRSPVRELDWR